MNFLYRLPDLGLLLGAGLLTLHLCVGSSVRVPIKIKHNQHCLSDQLHFSESLPTDLREKSFSFR